MKADFVPKAIIEAALKGASSTKPVKQEAILARGKTAEEKTALKDALIQMSRDGAILNCTLTQVDKGTKKSKTTQTYWPTGMAAKLPYSYGRNGRPTSSALVSL